MARALAAADAACAAGASPGFGLQACAGRSPRDRCAPSAIRSTSTRWLTTRIMPRSCGRVGVRSTALPIRPSFSERSVSRCARIGAVRGADLLELRRQPSGASSDAASAARPRRRRPRRGGRLGASGSRAAAASAAALVRRRAARRRRRRRCVDAEHLRGRERPRSSATSSGRRRPLEARPSSP